MSHGCGSGGCGCASTGNEKETGASTLTAEQAVAYEALATAMEAAPVAQSSQAPAGVAQVMPLAAINGIALHEVGQLLDEETLRQRACTELLRQAAQQAGLLSSDDMPGTDGATSAAASAAIEQLLERELPIPEPSEEACRRYHEAHPAAHAHGERAQLRHVLFAVTPGVDVKQLRLRAEAMLIDLRCADDGGVRFAEAAKQWSNCPSGQEGGDLGWLQRGQTTPEFDRQVFRLRQGLAGFPVESRWGYHVVSIDALEAGTALTFEQVQPQISDYLELQVRQRDVQQFLLELRERYPVRGLEDIEAQAE